MYPRSSSLILALQLVASGCVLGATTLVAPTTTVETIEATHVVEIRTVPAGAVVRAGDESAKAPAKLPVRYRIERRGRTYRIWAVVLGALVSGATFTYFMESGDSILPWTRDGFPIYLAGSDMLLAAFVLPAYFARNDQWRSRATQRALPVTRELVADWPGFAPARSTVVVPVQRYVTLRRPSLGTFDEALIGWDRTAKVEPTTSALIELAGAYDRLVQQTRRIDEARRAIQLYERYAAASDAVADKVEHARSRAAALRTEFQIP